MNSLATQIPLAQGRVPAGIIHVIGLFPELLGVGGVQEAGRSTAAALERIARRRGWSTAFLGLNDLPGRHALSVAGERIYVRGFARKKIRFTLAALALSRFKNDSAGIVLAAHPHLAVPADWISRISPRFKTVVMAHGVEVREKLPLVRRNALLHADLVLAPSRATAESLKRFQGVADEKIRKLAWPLNPEFLRLAAASGSLPLPRGFPKGQVILTVGRMASSERYKGVDDLICAVANLCPTIPDLHLVVVGNGDDLSRLRQLARDAGIAGRTHFLSGCSREHLVACYANARIFALPSTGEGFGLVFLEAMAASKPVVAVSAAAATELIEDGVNGLLVPPGDVGKLAQSLSRLLHDEALRSSLGSRSTEIVRQRFAFDAFEAALEQILGECAAGSSAALDSAFAR